MSQIKIANAPCSWGVLEFGLEGEAAGYEQVLDEIAQTGYEGTELGDWGFMPTNPDQLREECEKRGLAMAGAFVPVALANPDTHEEGVSTAIRIAKLMTAVNPTPFIVLADENGTVETRTKCAGRIQSNQGLSDEQWDVFAKGSERIAKAVIEETGVRTVFHHHCAGYIETPQEIDRLMNLTDPSLLGLCLDMGHYTYGGGDPLKTLRTLTDRIWHIHFKDCHPTVAAQARENEWDYFEAVKNGVFCELGKGEVDFPGIVKELKLQNYTGWIVVEQDVLPGMGTPIDSAQRNRDYLRSLGL